MSDVNILLEKAVKEVSSLKSGEVLKGGHAKHCHEHNGKNTDFSFLHSCFPPVFQMKKAHRFCCGMP